MWIIAPNHQTEHGDPNGGIVGRIEESEGVCNSIGQTAISTNQTSQSFLGLNYQPEFTHGGSSGSRCILRRGGTYLVLVGGETLGHVKAQFCSEEGFLTSEVGGTG